MKTKVLLSAMTMAVALAGCSNEEWNDNSQKASDLNGRRAVGEVVLSFSDAATRMEQNEAGNIVFSDNDLISASLMDEFNGTYPITSLVNYIQTNYPFSKDENNQWKSTGVLLEGNYFFAYPFDGCLQTRGALTNTVPVNQYAYDENGQFNAWQPYIDNQFYVGYKYLHADEACEDCNEVGVLNANVKLEKVHAYPFFTFTNQTGSPLEQPLTIYKLSLRKADQSMFYNTVAVSPKAKGFKADPTGELADENGKYSLWQTAVYNLNLGDKGYINPFGFDVINSSTLEYNVIFPEGGYEVKNWDSFEVGMVVPAGLYGPMEVVLYTNEGVGVYPVFGPENGEDYQVQSGVYKLSPDRKSNTAIRIDINSLKTNKTNFTVQSTENFVEYLKYVTNAGNSLQLIVKTVGDKVELSQEVYDILKNKNLKLRLNGTLIIPEGVPSDAIDRINFFDAYSKLIIKGDQVVEKMPASDKYILDSNVMFENEGTLTLKTDVPHSTIINKGQLIIEDADVFTLINTYDGNVVVNKELSAINLINMGEMTINTGAKVNSLESFANLGTLSNNGELETWPMNVVNEKIWKDYEDQYFNYDVTVPDYSAGPTSCTKPLWHMIIGRHDDECYPETTTTEVINIPKLFETFILSDAKVANLGTINNNGTINCNGKVITLDNFAYVPVLEDEVQVGEFTLARVTSMLNIGAGVIYNNNGGRITNLSNFAYLNPAPTSYTYLVTADFSSDNVAQIEFVKAYLQGYHVWEQGIINMTDNDGKDDQAVIRDNVTMQDISAINHNQIIFVLREKADVSNLPKYVNTIWLNNAVGTMSPATADMTKYTMVFSGTNTVKIATKLTLGEAIFAGDTRFWGEGTTELTDNIHVNKDVTLTTDNVWDATSAVSIFARGAKVIIGGQFNTSKINVDYESLSDYVGPWIVE